MITKNSPPVIDDVEKVPVVWINEKQMKGNAINDVIIYKKVQKLYVNLMEETQRTLTDEHIPFKVNKAWFQKFNGLFESFFSKSGS